jgi:hypothetical protein
MTTEWTREQMRAQWLLAGRLTGALSFVQMAIFAVLLIRTGSVTTASLNFWLLVLGFSISGVVAAVCLSRSRALPMRTRGAR